MTSRFGNFFRGRSRTGFKVEAFKLAVFITLPVAATLFFDLPSIKRAIILDRQYIVYPAEEGREKLEQIKKGKLPKLPDVSS
mmetsp:Transcript_6629/g.13057  ORF Transcript_6629/g.13057 Transcript_6629/m.13057 type:complete len:82 (+) Transcript_6629:49-294(+)